MHLLAFFEKICTSGLSGIWTSTATDQLKTKKSKFFARAQTLLDASKLIHDQNLNLFFLGKIIDKNYSPKGILLLDALYIGGSSEDVHKLWMRAENL